MGLFQRPPESGCWWISWCDSTGARHREKVGRSKTAAEQLYRKRKEDDRVGRKLDNIGRKARRLTLAEAAAQFREKALEKKRPRAAVAYDHHLSLWAHLHDELLEQVTVADIEAWKRQMAAKGRRPATINRGLSWLKRLFNLSVRGGVLEVNPMAGGGVQQLEEDNRSQRFFSEDEEAALHRPAPPAFQRWMTLAAQTGLRREEQFALRRDQVDLRRSLITLPETREGHDGSSRARTKAKDTPYVRLNKLALAALREQLASHDNPTWVFPSRNGQTHITLTSVSRRFQRLVKKLQAARQIGPARATWHTWRHTFISRLCMAGVPLPTVQKLARHKTIAMTLRYAHLCPSHEQDAVEKLVKFSTGGTPGGTGTEATRECLSKSSTAGRWNVTFNRVVAGSNPA